MKLELKNLMRRALDYADRHGTEVQSTDMAGIVAQLAQSAGELEDITSGVRDARKHPHHQPEQLRQSIIVGKRTIGLICREIVSGK